MTLRCRRLAASVNTFVAASVAVLLVAVSSVANADNALDARLRHLESGLRCLVCQNQTLAESEAGLAVDLRREVREQALAGKSDDEIRRYLVARYGDFVLYDPPLKPVTWLLWFGPFVLLAGGVAVWFVVGRNRRGSTVDPATGFEEQARRILDGADARNPSRDAARQSLDA